MLRKLCLAKPFSLFAKNFCLLSPASPSQLMLKHVVQPQTLSPVKHTIIWGSMGIKHLNSKYKKELRQEIASRIFLKLIGVIFGTIPALV